MYIVPKIAITTVSRGAQIPAPGCYGSYLVGWRLYIYMQILGTFYHPLSALNFQEDPKFFENLCTPEFLYIVKYYYLQFLPSHFL